MKEIRVVYRDTKIINIFFKQKGFVRGRTKSSRSWQKKIHSTYARKRCPTYTEPPVRPCITQDFPKLLAEEGSHSLQPCIIYIVYIRPWLLYIQAWLIKSKGQQGLGERAGAILCPPPPFSFLLDNHKNIKSCFFRFSYVHIICYIHHFSSLVSNWEFRGLAFNFQDLIKKINRFE